MLSEWCVSALVFCWVRLFDTVPPRALSGTVGGAGVPKRRCVGAVEGVSHVAVAPFLASPYVVPCVGAYAPLPMCGGSACLVLCSLPPAYAVFV